LLNGERNPDAFAPADSTETSIMEIIMLYIEDHYSKELDREHLAHKAGMNIHRFSRVFNETFGQSVKSYLNHIRIHKAAELLRNSKELSVTKIAASVGYTNMVHFERVFREVFGTSPRKFRMNYNAESAQSRHLWHFE
ncbi:MAG: helix-turn-helix domain-containing protein, partial [Nitrospirota bacterium]